MFIRDCDQAANLSSKMKTTMKVEHERNSPRVCHRSFKRKAKVCWCLTNPDVFKSRQINYEEILQIPGISDVTLMGNDSSSKIQTSKVLLAQLGQDVEQLLKHSEVKLNYPFSVVKTIHKFTLTGECIFEPTNLESLLTAAKEFNLVGIQVQAGQHLIKSIDTGNAHKMHKMSTVLLCPHIAEQTTGFILENFEELGLSDNFLKNCSPIWMQELIKDETLNVSEENLFQIVVKWASLSLENENALNAFLTDIRFGLMENTFFDSEVKMCPLLENNPYIQVPNTRSGFRGLRKLDKPRVPSELVFAVGGYTTKPTSTLEVFDTRATKWSEQKAGSFPTHAYHGAASRDGKLYVLGGYGQDEQMTEFFQVAYCMDLSTKVWTKKSAMQNRRCYASVVELGGKIYCIGGYNGSIRFNTVECYDPDTNQWSMTKPMNQIRSDACAVTNGIKIFVLGGFNGADIHPSIEIYNPQSDEWTYGPRMSQPRSGLQAVVLNSKLYAIGGFNGNERIKSVETLDLSKPYPNWEITSELNNQRSNFGATVVEKKILVAGGFDGHQVINNTEIFSEETNLWTESQPMKVKRSALCLVTVKGLPNRKKYLTHRL